MMQALLHIRISAQQPLEWEVPLFGPLRKAYPALTTFDFDNYSEESIRSYAVELLKQSGQVAVVVTVEDPQAPISGLTTFFNRLLKNKPERLLLILQGQQPVLQKMMQTIGGEHFQQGLSAKALEQRLLEFFNRP
jgi:hypothetical protein